MLFAVLYHYRDTVTEESQKRNVALFSNWTPPEGYEMRDHYFFCDSSGGVVIVEAESAAAVLEAHIPFCTNLEFKTVPVVSVEESIEIFNKVDAWRDTVK